MFEFSDFKILDYSTIKTRFQVQSKDSRPPNRAREQNGQETK